MTTRVSPRLLDLSQIPVFRADTSGLSTIPTGLVSPTWFTAFGESFDTSGSATDVSASITGALVRAA